MKKRYRGKRVNNDDWVYGDLRGDGYHSYINDIVVDPLTICEFTDFYDKNDTQIFDKDIVDFIDDTGNELLKGIYIEIDSRFGVIGYKDGTFFKITNDFCKHCKVVGNCFDDDEEDDKQ